MPPTISIIIKTLNEERHISESIASALEGLRTVEGGGEVIMADSASTDSTVKLAEAFPISIVQVASEIDRSCGTGGQLGFQFAKGEFIYILDGDMTLHPAFLSKAHAALVHESDLGGVAGIVEERIIANSAFALRAATEDTSTASTNSVSLNMGGLYRRKALEDLGYFTNRNLHSFEEFELGVRLLAKGWRLARLPIPSVVHYGRAETSLSLIARRWQTKYACGHGELVRASIGKPYFWLVLRKLRVLKVQFIALLFWLSTVTAGLAIELSAPCSIGLGFLAWVVAFFVLAMRRRSISKAAYSITAWHVGIAGFLRGLLTRQPHSPTDIIQYRVIKLAPVSHAAS